MTIATGAVFTLSLLIPQLDLKNRSLQLKQNYISLQKLTFELKFCEDEESIVEINNNYLELLRGVENHNKIDMYYFIAYEAGANCTRKISLKEWGLLISYLSIRTLILVLLYLLPLVMLVIYATI